MNSAEFRAEIKNGAIEIPDGLRHLFKDQVRVILYAEDKNGAANLIDQLLQHPIQSPGFKPLKRAQAHERS